MSAGPVLVKQRRSEDWNSDERSARSATFISPVRESLLSEAGQSREDRHQSQDDQLH